VSIYYKDESVILYHGDSLVEETSWSSGDVLITDPPYGMAYESGWTERRAIAGDKDTDARDRALAMWGDRPGAVFGTWRVSRPAHTKQVITWHKTSLGPGMGDLSMPWGNATEEIYVLGTGWHGRRRQNIIATSDQRGGSTGVSALVGHPTPKPVGLLEQLIECAPEGVIVDPFAGGGSTLLAARNLGRQAIGVEVEERYCEVIARRLAQGVLV